MRWVDDLIDHRRFLGQPIHENEKALIRQEVTECMLACRQPRHPGMEDLCEIREPFALPTWPWERWIRSMLYDLDHNGYRTFLDYFRYCEDAAGAPGAIFMHLCGVRSQSAGYIAAVFNIRQPARPLAIFFILSTS